MGLFFSPGSLVPIGTYVNDDSSKLPHLSGFRGPEKSFRFWHHLSYVLQAMPEQIDDMLFPQDPNDGILVSRRHFLTRTALTSAGLFFGLSQDGWATMLGPSPAEVSKKLGIPANWVEEMGRPLVEYAVYIERHKLKNMTVCQVIEPHTHTRSGVRNQIPPKSMWPSVTKVLRVADRLSDYLGERVGAVVSAYRSPAYNGRCPGARSRSMHLRNMALDLKFKSISPSRVASMAKAMRQRGLFAGGIGRYSTFTHIDTRGENIDW